MEVTTPPPAGEEPDRAESPDGPTPSTPPPVVVLLLNAKQAAALCGISPATWHRLTATGKNPRAVKIGRAARWPRSDLERWIELRCPERTAFETIQAADRGPRRRNPPR